MPDSLLGLLLPLVLSLSSPTQEAAVPLPLADFHLELEARWEPLTDTVYHFETRFPWLAELTPAAEHATYGAEAFRALLPAEPVAVGAVWRIDADAFLPFLRQFHPGFTTTMHHDVVGSGIAAPGAYGVLRAVSETHAEVWLRAHLDFLLRGEAGIGRGDWLTPAQFAGRMWIDRRSGRVAAFQLGVPDQSANVDVNVAEGHGVIADIGRLPRMELSSRGLGTRAAGLAGISEAAARDALAKAFYPSAQIEWLDLATARARSRATNKPLHVVVLFGSLLDESC